MSAFATKEGTGSRRRIPLNEITALAVVLLLRFLRGGSSLAIHSPALGAVGVLLCASGIALAVWARIHLGRNWGRQRGGPGDGRLHKCCPAYPVSSVRALS